MLATRWACPHHASPRIMVGRRCVLFSTGLEGDSCLSSIAQSYEAIALCYKQGEFTAIVSLGLKQPQASVPEACCLLGARGPPSLSNAIRQER